MLTPVKRYPKDPNSAIGTPHAAEVPIHNFISYPKALRYGTEKLPPPIPTIADVEVYLNGYRQTAGVDWFLNSLGISADQDDDTADITNVTADAASVTGTGVVYFNTRPNDGDGVAIVVKIGHDYIIEGSNLVTTSLGDENDEIRVTSFTNHDLLGIRTEIFKGSALTDATLGTYQTLLTQNPVTTGANKFVKSTNSARQGKNITRVPMVSNLNVQCQPLYSRNEITNNFSLKQFASGGGIKDGFI